LLKPERDDYFVLKPKHSGFYSTTLDLLLKHLGAATLILAGFTADICILFTANDAYMRDYRLMIPADCVASQDDTENQRALKFMERVLKAHIRPSTASELTASRTTMSFSFFLVAGMSGAGSSKRGVALFFAAPTFGVRSLIRARD